jgi:hypothetical protein
MAGQTATNFSFPLMGMGRGGVMPDIERRVHAEVTPTQPFPIKGEGFERAWP